MPLAARVTEVSVTDDGSLYVALAVWATVARRTQGRAPDVQNDFVFNIERTATRPVTNATGQVRTPGGPWVDPRITEPPVGGWEMETYTLTREELRAMVREHMRAWVRRHVAAKRGNIDDRSTWIQRRTDSDPRGLLAEVAGIVGEEFEE
jgi:hypothetical protein